MSVGGMSLVMGVWGDDLNRGERLGRWLVLILLWSIPGVVSSTQVYFIQQRFEPIEFWQALLWQMPAWLFWVPATPLVLWLGRRFPVDRDHRMRNLALHAVATLAVALPHLAVMVEAGRAVGIDPYNSTPFVVAVTRQFTSHIHLDIVTYWGVLAAGYAMNYYRAYRERELATSKLETRLARAELQALKGQLHPHFLFNTLNAIGVLIRKQDDQNALRTLSKLSELLRITLDNAGRHTVVLKQEIEFLDRYLEIQRIRFADRLSVRQSIDSSLYDAFVPTLILQPLVENAVVHGIAARANAGTVEIAASRDGNQLRLEVSDDGVGLPASWRPETSEGVGIQNVRARLATMYGDQHSFDVKPRDGGGTIATIEIPLSMEGFDE